MIYNRGVWIFVLLSLLVFPFTLAEDNWGCCADYELGFCRLVEGDAEIDACGSISGNQFYLNQLCTPSAINPTADVTTDLLCQSTGFCCFDDSQTFETGFSTSACEIAGGRYEEGSSAAVCGFEVPDDTISCTSVGGYYCEFQPAGGISLESQINFRGDRPSSSFTCYDRPCDTAIECSPDIDYGIEYFCSDGINNDAQFCEVDGADPFCGQSISGTVVDEFGNGVSNVKIRFTNLDHEGESFQDVFTTYSIGGLGKYNFKGLSIGRYSAEIIDSEYASRSEPFTFTVSRANPTATLNFVVELRNSFTLSGIVTSPQGDPLSNVLVSLEQDGKYTTTNSQGRYEIRGIAKPFSGSLTLFAYSSDYQPYQNSFVPDSDSGTTVDITLGDVGCSINPLPPSLNELSVTKGKAEIILDFSSTCSVDSFDIYRCKGKTNTCNGNFAFSYVGSANGQFSTFVDDSVEWDTEYTYQVQTKKNGLKSNPSNALTIYSGDSLCENKFNKGSFCEFDFQYNVDQFNTKKYLSSRGVYCSDENVVETYVGTGGPVECSSFDKCVEQNSGTAQATTFCKPITQCDPDTSNLFGLYYDENICEGANNQNFCVYDYSHSNTDFCFSCSSYTTCGDYRSENACGQNVCGVGACEWQEVNSEFGTGVCVDVNEPSCDDFNSPFNTVFGVGDVTACESVGGAGSQTCSVEKSSNLCTDCNELSCYDYSNQNSCTGGGSSIISINPLTNGFSSGSADACGISACSWDTTANSCYKDSNADGNDDCEDFENGRVEFSLIQGLLGYNYAACIKDSTPPETSISLSRQKINPAYPVNGQLDVFLNSFDTIGTDEKYDVDEVYICLTGANSDNCKSTSDYVALDILNQQRYFSIADATQDLTVTIQGKTFQLSPGQNVIKYFAEDHAKNKELIKFESFIVDITPPDVEQNIIKKFGDETTTIDIYTTSDEPIYCWQSVNSCEDLGNCDPFIVSEENVTQDVLLELEDEFSTTVVKSIASLPDGAYFLKSICSDQAGNMLKFTEQIFVDKDGRIFNPKPVGATEYTSIELSVNTFSDVSCRYTDDVSLSYDQISSSQQLQKSWTGSNFKHSTDLAVSRNKEYVYYVKCDFTPESVERISFTQDSLVPNVTARYGLLDLASVGWISDGNIILECNDVPENGFGCAEITYCITDAPTVSDINQVGRCTPDTVYSGNLQIDDPSSICFTGTENEVNGQGGRVSNIKCNNVFVDKTDPILIVDTFLPVHNNREITLSGAVYDDYVQGSLIFTDEASLFAAFSNRESAFITEEESIEDFDMVSEFSYISGGEIRFVFNHLSSTSYGAVVVNTDENTLSIGRQGILGYNAFIEEDLLNANNYRIRVSKEGDTVSVVLQDVVSGKTQFLEYSDSYFSNSRIGKFGTLIDGSDAFVNLIKPNLDSQSLYYSENSPVSDLPKTVFLYIGGSLKETQVTNGAFSFTTELSQGNLYHGNIYPITIFAEDVAGRRSEQVSQDVKLDFAGPEVTSIKITPATEQEEDNYIEYGTSANVQVTLTDEFSSIGEVLVSVDGNTFSLSEDFSGSFSGILELFDVPAGTFDVLITATDILGNQYTQTMEDVLLIEDRLDPVITFKEKVLYVNTISPTITFNTEESADCSIRYPDGEIQASNIFAESHTFTLVKELKGQVNKEIKNTVTVICSDRNGRRVNQNIDVIVDQRNPLYTIQINEPFVHKDISSRHSMSFTALRSLDVRLFTSADEPVICRYAKDTLPASYERYPLATLQSYEYRLTDKTTPTFLSNGNSMTYYFLCQDRAGNLGVVKEVDVNVDTSISPILFELEDSGVIRFKSVRELSCTYEFNGNSGVVPSIIQTPTTFLYEKDVTSLLQNGRNDISVTCSLSRGSASTTESITVYKDVVSPTADITLNGTIDLSSSVDLVEIDSSTIPVEVGFSENVFAKIYVNNILQIVQDDVTSLSDTLVLDYGYNSISVLGIDKGGNEVKEDFAIISYNQKPNIMLSNGLSSSIRKSYRGKILAPEDVSFTARVIGSEGQRAISIVNNDIDISTDILSNVSSSVEKTMDDMIFQDSITLEITGTSNAGSFVHKEVFYFHEYAEEIIFEIPEFRTIYPEDLENNKDLIITGYTDQENYAYETILLYNNVENSSFMKSGSFEKRFVQDSGYTQLEFSLDSDLGITTKTGFLTFFDTLGPDPIISIYPEGDESYIPAPEFLVQFSEPATIIEAQVRDLLGNTVYQFTDEELRDVPVFIEKLQLPINLPTESSYLFTLSAIDQLGNANSKDFEFLYVDKPLSLEIISPEFGVSKENNFTFTVLADRYADCRIGGIQDSYETMDDMRTSGREHSYTTYLDDDQARTYYIQCLEQGDELSEIVPIVVSVDKTAPVISKVNLVNKEVINNIPYITNFPLQGEFEITANEEVYCKYDLVPRTAIPETRYEDMVSDGLCSLSSKGLDCFNKNAEVIVSNLADRQAYTIAFSCRDKAGWVTAESKLVEFQVDLSQGDKVQIISPTSEMSTQQVPITIITNIPADQCFYGLDNQPVTAQFSRISSDKTVFNSTTSIGQGRHSIAVSCIIGNNTYNVSRSFLVDSTPPTLGKVVVPETTTSLSILYANAVNFTDNETGISYYEYAIGTSPYGNNGWNSLVNWTQISRQSMSAKDLDLSLGETYYWSVRAWNDVGADSGVVSSLGTEVVAQLNETPECDVCGAACGIPCQVGDACVFDDDCYSDQLYCSDEYVCALIDEFDGLDEQIDEPIVVNETVEDVSLEPVVPETNTEVVKKDLSWLYWILAFGVLIALAGGGYYAYVIYGKKDDEDTISRSDSSMSSGQLNESAPSAQELAMQAAAAEDQKKKDALKAALKKKLVEDQKKDDEVRRQKLFNKFGAGEDSKAKVIPQKPSSEHIEKLADDKIKQAAKSIKDRLKEDKVVEKKYVSHPAGDEVHKNELLEKHKQLVENTNTEDLETDDVLAKLRDLSKGKKSPTKKSNSKETTKKSAVKAKPKTSKPTSKQTTSNSKSSKTKSSSSLDKLKSMSSKK